MILQRQIFGIKGMQRSTLYMQNIILQVHKLNMSQCAFYVAVTRRLGIYTIFQLFHVAMPLFWGTIFPEVGTVIKLISLFGRIVLLSYILLFLQLLRKICYFQLYRFQFVLQYTYCERDQFCNLLLICRLGTMQYRTHVPVEGVYELLQPGLLINQCLRVRCALGVLKYIFLSIFI